MFSRKNHKIRKRKNGLMQYTSDSSAEARALKRRQGKVFFSYFDKGRRSAQYIEHQQWEGFNPQNLSFVHGLTSTYLTTFK